MNEAVKSKSTESKSTESNSTSLQKKSLSAFDGVFIGLIALALVAGIQLSKVKDQPSPFGVSVLFGSAISLLTYYFLGGINKDEASVKAGLGNSATIALGGSVAALVGTTLISNSILEKQMRKIDLSYQPSGQALLIVNQDAELVRNLKLLGMFGSINEEKVLEVSPELARKVMEICNQGKGFCKRSWQEVKLKINQDLNKGFATVCKDHEWDSYPLMITSRLPGSEAVRVTIVADQVCVEDEDHYLIGISEEDANLLKISVNGAAVASIPPLKGKFPRYVYKTAQRNP